MYKIIAMDNEVPWKSLSDIPLDVLNNGWFYHIAELKSEWCDSSKIVGANKDTIYVACGSEILSVPLSDFVNYYLYNMNPSQTEVYHLCSLKKHTK